MKIIPVANVDEVLSVALAQPLTPIEWTEEDKANHDNLSSSAKDEDEGKNGLVRH